MDREGAAIFILSVSFNNEMEIIQCVPEVKVDEG
jgi:hypothetical protein